MGTHYCEDELRQIYGYGIRHMYTGKSTPAGETHLNLAGPRRKGYRASLYLSTGGPVEKYVFSYIALYRGDPTVRKRGHIFALPSVTGLLESTLTPYSTEVDRHY